MYRCTDDKPKVIHGISASKQISDIRFLGLVNIDSRVSIKNVLISDPDTFGYWFTVYIHLSCLFNDNPEISQPQSPLPGCE